MNDRVLLILTIVGFVWGLYKCFKEKNERLFYSLLLVAGLLIPRYTSNWPIELSLAIWAFLGFFVIGYKILYKKLDKSLLVFAIVFLTFAIIFLLQGLWPKLWPFLISLKSSC